MRSEEEFTKKSASIKKRQRRNRRIKTIVILVAIVTVISLVFYALDHPDFLENIKGRINALYSSDPDLGVPEEDAGLTVDSMDDSGNGDDTYLVSGGESEHTEAGMDEEAQDPGDSFISNIWQKIMDFFSSRMNVDEERFPSNLEILVYFASLGEEEKFVFEERTINAGDKKIAVENTIRELLEGPVKSFHYPVIPPGTELIDVEIYENTAKINLSQDFIDNSLDSGILDEFVIFTIVNTVTQVPGIDGVVFFVDGIRIKTYGNVDLSIPVIKNEKYLESEDSNE